MKNISGHCVCGAVQCVIDEYGDFIYVCHCGVCRRLGSGPAHSIDPGTSENFHIVKGCELIGIYISHEGIERGFCTKCGTRI
jgi:hypothetical protein